MTRTELIHIIGETPDPDGAPMNLWEFLCELEWGDRDGLWGDRMIAAIAERVEAAVAREAGEAGP